MDPRDLSQHYPVLYHMAEAGSWDSISEHGLLSTRSLIDLFEVDGDARDAILRARRPASVRSSTGSTETPSSVIRSR